MKTCNSFLFLFLKLKVAGLRQKFFHSIAPGGLAGDRRGVVPASGFSFSAQQIWKVIKENRDLDLPAHKVTAILFTIPYLIFPLLILLVPFMLYVIISNKSIHYHPL